MVARILKHYDRKVTIAVVGKYVELHDAYISIAEALKHAAVANESEIEIKLGKFRKNGRRQQC